MSVSKLFKPIVFVAVAVLAVLGIANVFGYSPLPLSQSERSQTVLLKSIKDVSQLHGAVGTFERVVDTGDDDGGMPDIIAGRRTLFVAASTVNAHVDLSSLAEEDLTLSADGKSVKVRLPEPQLDKPNIDHDRSYVYSQDRGLVDRIADAIEAPQQAELFKLGETDIAAAAEKSELRERAAENTKACSALSESRSPSSTTRPARPRDQVGFDPNR